MADAWVMTRLKAQTRAALRQWAEDWQRAFEQGQVKEGPPASPSNRMDEGPSVDQLVAELLRRDEAHRARARKQRQRGPRGMARLRAGAGRGRRGGMEAPDVAATG